MKALHLFAGIGVEMEYMIVDQKNLNVLPISDKLIQKAVNAIVSTVERGEIAWSNELVMHVIELKTNGPASDLEKLPDYFHKNIIEINTILNEFGAKLLPTGMHPLMNPHTETQLWPYGSNEIYAAFNKIFDCKGHGWSNVQSTHINLPFYDDDEFAKLHTAIRLLLPIIPALTASSPIAEGKISDYQDARLDYYQNNQKAIPSIAGHIIPEAILTKKAYETQILQRMYADIKPFDPDSILQEEWLNSRGACARFDRNAIEIRIIDSQECVVSELAIVFLLVAVLKSILSEQWLAFERQVNIPEAELFAIWRRVIAKGQAADFTQFPAYPGLFGLKDQQATAGMLWHHIVSQIAPLPAPFAAVIDTILTHGNLSTRILNALHGKSGRENINQVYQQLADCLRDNKVFS